MHTVRQIAFWQTLANELAENTHEGHADLAMVLAKVRAAVSDAPLASIIEGVLGNVRQGQSLSQALAGRKDIFPSGLVLMVRAAEASGNLRVAAQRAAQVTQEGLFRQGDRPAKGRPEVRFWRILGTLMSAGVPILQALELLQDELAGPDESPWSEAAQTMRQAVLTGQPLPQSMQSMPHLFDPKTVAAIEAGSAAGELDRMSLRIAAALEGGELDDLTIPPPPLTDQDGTRQATQTIHEIINEGIRSRANDIALEMLEGSRLRIRQRIDGVLHDVRTFPEGTAMPVVNQIKAMAGLEIAERRLPQDGRINLRLGDKDIDIRVSTMPVIHGERVCMRLLIRQAMTFDLEKIGMTPESLATTKRFCRLPAGIVIVNGPTGAGKTTLLYAMLQAIDTVEQMIVTVEDPVEYSFDRISQIQVRPEIGLSFTRAIRGILRQDPDVIMIGEIRDREVLDMCVQCAMTGHLVLTTLHATTSGGAIRRMLDMGLPPFMLNASLQGIITQRLARRLCPHCRQPAKLDTADLPTEVAKILAGLKHATLFSPKGCPRCSQTGYAGRTSLHEVLTASDAIRTAISENATAARLRDLATHDGMKTLLEDGLTKAAQGITSVEEVLRIVPTEAYR